MNCCPRLRRGYLPRHSVDSELDQVLPPRVVNRHSTRILYNGNVGDNGNGNGNGAGRTALLNFLPSSARMSQEAQDENEATRKKATTKEKDLTHQFISLCTSLDC